MAVPMTIATAVRPSVTLRPRRIEASPNHSATTGHSKLRLVPTVTAVWAASTSTTTQATTLPQGNGRRAFETSIAPPEASESGAALISPPCPRG